MTATITKIQKQPSRLGGSFFYIFFKDEKGKSVRTAVYPAHRNYELWKPLCQNPERAVGVKCEGLVLKREGLYDADYLKKTYLPKGV